MAAQENIIQTQLTGRNASIPAPINLDQLLNVASGGGITTVTITPPLGELWRIKHLKVTVPVPVGATSGTHVVAIRYGANSSDYNILNATSNFGDAIGVNNVISLATAASGKFPLSEESQQANIFNLALTINTPLTLLYQNITNVAQTGNLVVRVIKEVEYIVS